MGSRPLFSETAVIVSPARYHDDSVTAPGERPMLERAPRVDSTRGGRAAHLSVAP